MRSGIASTLPVGIPAMTATARNPAPASIALLHAVPSLSKPGPGSPRSGAPEPSGTTPRTRPRCLRKPGRYREPAVVDPTPFRTLRDPTIGLVVTPPATANRSERRALRGGNHRGSRHVPERPGAQGQVEDHDAIREVPAQDQHSVGEAARDLGVRWIDGPFGVPGRVLEYLDDPTENSTKTIPPVAWTSLIWRSLRRRCTRCLQGPVAAGTRVAPGRRPCTRHQGPYRERGAIEVVEAIEVENGVAAAKPLPTANIMIYKMMALENCLTMASLGQLVPRPMRAGGEDLFVNYDLFSSIVNIYLRTDVGIRKPKNRLTRLRFDWILWQRAGLPARQEG